MLYTCNTCHVAHILATFDFTKTCCKTMKQC